MVCGDSDSDVQILETTSSFRLENYFQKQSCNRDQRPNGDEAARPTSTTSGPVSSNANANANGMVSGIGNGNGNLNLQVVNGQLVVQAQLQQIQTASGTVTVAVLPQAVLKQTAVLQLQQQQLQQSSRTAAGAGAGAGSTPVETQQPPVTSASASTSAPHLVAQLRPATPGSPALRVLPAQSLRPETKPKRCRAKKQDRPIKPRPNRCSIAAAAGRASPIVTVSNGLAAARPSQSQTLSAPLPTGVQVVSQQYGSGPAFVTPSPNQQTTSGITVQLSADKAEIVAKLTEHITSVQRRGNLSDPNTRNVLAELERQRSKIIQEALLTQHGSVSNRKREAKRSETFAVIKRYASDFSPSATRQIVPSAQGAFVSSTACNAATPVVQANASQIVNVSVKASSLGYGPFFIVLHFR